jgi:DNA-binding transcriptional LysR family regulator
LIAQQILVPVVLEFQRRYPEVCLAYMWEARIRADLACGHLVSVLDDWMPSSPGFCLYHPDRRNVPAALSAFIDMLR